jgi:hypothetical protein
VLANYDAVMATNRGAQIMMEDAPNARDRMEAWRRAKGTSDPIGNFNLFMDANDPKTITYADGAKNQALAYLKRAPSDPADAVATPETALAESISDSSYFNAEWNHMWGYTAPAGAKAMPEVVRPGLVGGFLSGIGNAALQWMYLTPGEGISVVFDNDRTRQAYRMATADAIAHGKPEGPGSNTMAMATMGKNDNGPSRLLFSQDFLGPMHDQALNSTYVYGYASPEKWYGLPAYVPVEDASIKAMRGNWWQKAEAQNPGILPMGSLPFLGYMGDLPPPGSPAFLKREFAEGNLRFRPFGIVNNRMEYDVMLRVQGPNKEQWIQYNPQGEFWHYDMQATGNYADALKGAQVGAQSARSLQDNISPYLGDTLATGLSYMYGKGKAWEVEYALKHQEYDAAQAWFVEHHGVLQNLPKNFATEALPVE